MDKHQEQPDMTEEEAKLSTMYSDVETWSRVLHGQFKSGTFLFRGPPGLWEKIAVQYGSTTAPETMLQPFR